MTEPEYLSAKTRNRIIRAAEWAAIHLGKTKRKGKRWTAFAEFAEMNGIDCPHPSTLCNLAKEKTSLTPRTRAQIFCVLREIEKHYPENVEPQAELPLARPVKIVSSEPTAPDAAALGRQVVETITGLRAELSRQVAINAQLRRDNDELYRALDEALQTVSEEPPSEIEDVAAGKDG